MENLKIISYRKLLKIIKETKSLWQFDLLDNYKNDYIKLTNLWINEKSLKLNLFFYIKENGVEIPFYKSNTKEFILKYFSYEHYKHIVSQINNTIYSFSDWKYWLVWSY